MLKMGKKLYLLLGSERQEALNSLKRLDDFDYDLESGLNAPTPEETEMMRKEIEDKKLDYELTDLYLYHRTSQRLEKYHRFLVEVEDLGISLRLSQNFDEKRELLRKHFPGKYERQGLGSYSAERLGKVFLGFLDYARKMKRRQA